MTVPTIRNVPAEVHRALQVSAAQHGRGTKAESCGVLESSAKPEQRVRVGLNDEDFVVFQRDKTPAEPISFA